MCWYCNIIPQVVLERLATDNRFSASERSGLVDASKLDAEIRKVREQARKLTMVASATSQAVAALAQTPSVRVYDCQTTTVLPGTPIANPGASTDATVRQTFDVTSEVINFYKKVFGRNSVDDAGMTLQSSVHYGLRYNNAFWNGFQMAYGDGDGAIFVDFTKGDDVMCHELTHGVTQFTLSLTYRNQPGGLNESMSDVFGSMFRQWRAKQKVTAADWLIGKDIMGPSAISQNITCLRDMANPKAAHCLAPQIDHFSAFTPGMDPHFSSGVPNLAFYKIAMALGGHSWDKAGQIWYKALTGGRSPNMSMKQFAKRTRAAAAALYPGDAATANAVNNGWAAVGL
jgi:Zn-dependent metalloprotease